MSNFYLDNDDIRFNLEQAGLGEIAALMEDDFRFAQEHDEAPKNAEEAVQRYQKLLEEFGRIAAQEIAPTATHTDEVGNILNDDGSVTYTPGIENALEKLGGQGFMGLTLPYRYGGLNCPNVLLTATNDIISRADASLMNLYGLQGIAETINDFADDGMKDEFLADMAAGRKTGAMVLTEPEAGSDLQSVKVTAEEQPDGSWRINGVKRFITNGCGHVLLVMARSEADITDGRGLSLFLVERGEGVRVRRLENKLGIHGSPTCELEFTNAPARLVGERQQGLVRYVMALMYGARLGIAAQSLGIAESAYRVALDYAHERKQFGSEIAQFPAVRELLVESRLDIIAARALTYYASASVDRLRGMERDLERDAFDDAGQKRELKQAARKLKKVSGMLTPMSKYYGSEMSMRVTNHAISVMGGNGYMHDYPLERHLRDSRITTIYEGTTQLQIVAASSAVVNGAAKALVEQLLEGEWAPPVAELADQIRAALPMLDEAIERTKSDNDPNYRRLHARRLTDMALTLIIAALLAGQARASDKRLAFAKHWLETRLPEFRAMHERIMSGERLALAAFETLAELELKPDADAKAGARASEAAMV